MTLCIMFPIDESHVWIYPGNHISLSLIDSPVELVVAVVFHEANVKSGNLILKRY